MDYRQAVLKAFEAGKSDTPMAVAFADALFDAYEAGRVDRVPGRAASDEDWQQFLIDRGDKCAYVDSDFYVLLKAEKRRMDYIRANANISPAILTLAWPTDKTGNVDERLDAAIKEAS